MKNFFVILELNLKVIKIVLICKIFLYYVIFFEKKFFIRKRVVKKNFGLILT